MADDPGMIASAVIVPESADHADSPSGTKRRQSATSDSGSSKRPRLSEEPIDDAATAEVQPRGQQDTKSAAENGSSQTIGKDAGRRRGGKDEERQRGRRLFGALLGTLSQSTNTTAQRRRADIEKKQRTKLREEAEEFDEKQRQRRDELLAERKKEQKKYDQQSMRLRHSIMLATANFLKTETQPPLYYLPWQLRPEEIERLERQKKDVSARIEEELEVGRQEELDLEKSSDGNVQTNGMQAVTGDGQVQKKPDATDPSTSSGPEIDPPTPSPTQPPEVGLEPAPGRESGPLEDTEELDVEAEAGEDPVIY